MKHLKNILTQITPKQIIGTDDLNVLSVCIDSRKAASGSMFVAISGTQVDGHLYIEKAVELGAVCVVCEIIPKILIPNITYIQVENSAKAAGVIASYFYGNPSSKLTLVGITGTNGKTSTVTLLYQLFKKLGYKVGLLSTVKNCIDEEIIPSTHTTPDCISLNALLAKMVEAGCTHCFMEVSSHAIHQERIAGLHFSVAAFSNITHDHLDYHGDFKSYIQAKKKFFDELDTTAVAITNKDDRNGLVMVQNCSATIKTYSLSANADFSAQILENTFEGLVLKLDGEELHTKLVGEFNAYNILVVYGIATVLGVQKTNLLTQISTLEAVDGRFNYVISPNDKIVGIVDYAHTPDALEKVLSTIHHSKTKAVQTICIVGCGGDRDAAKRPIMASTACKMSDRVILTSDNPRSEEPVSIIKEMQEGVSAEMKRKVLSIVDRREAIRTACTLAERGDVILLAGKGHETYQEIKGVKYPFDDRAILLETFKEMNR